MNILIPDSWLREYLETNATPKDIQRCLSLCGPSVERLHKKDGDFIYDIEVTTNRVDCMSVYGIAREAVAILPQFGFQASLKPLITTKLTTGAISGLTIKNDPKLCKRILALKINNINIEPSPKWLFDRLESVGIRPINNLVDITNYVMWEVGHPTHVFDFDRISTGKMIIREAVKNEKIMTLDDKTYVLKGGEVVIDDDHGKIIDLPSIMGTANSVVIPQTISALFFVDSVESPKVRFASMSHSIRTQAAALLEKNVDPELGLTAIFRMAKILKDILPQSKISPLLDIYPHKPEINPITINIAKFNDFIGVNLDPVKIINILKSLNFQVKITKSVLTVTPPSYRAHDIRIPEDLIEEVARVYGYHNIPSVLITGSLPDKPHDQTFSWEEKIKTSLKYLGFTESYTYSMVNDSPDGLKISNPLSSEWTQLRTGLTPSHLKLISENIGKDKQLSFFEIADVYLPQKHGLPIEESRLIVSSNSSDYYKFKGHLETFLSDLRIQNLIPGIKFIEQSFIWEISVNQLITHAKTVKTYTPISKFMPLIEDFNITLSTNYADLEEKIKSFSPLISTIELTDKFNSKLTIRLTFLSSDKQLTKEDIASIRTRIENFH